MTEQEQQTFLSIYARCRRNEIRLTPYKADKISMSSTKIGGMPSVPSGFKWPFYRGIERRISNQHFISQSGQWPLAFLMQVNLRETAAFDTEGLLPKSGMLSFFYEMQTGRWGFEADALGSARVFYFPEELPLHQQSFPNSLQPDYRFPEAAIKTEAVDCYPSLPDFLKTPEGQAFDKAHPDLTDEDWETLADCIEELDDESFLNRTKLLGWPMLIQDSMEIQCETVSRGYGMGSPEIYARIAEETRASIEKHASDWTLLLQLNTEVADITNFYFGDAGQLYFWIKKYDLEKCNFNHTWTILQCH